jgi:hypothetical protein
MNNIEFLQEWFVSQCDGDWEHNFGITVETLDNPGWGVFIDLRGTSIEGVSFEPVEEKRSENNWLSCCINEGRFEGFGGPGNLMEILGVFKRYCLMMNQ